MAVDPNSPDGRSAKKWLDSILAAYGLTQRGWTPGNYLWSLFQAGWSPQEIALEMRNMPEYKIRFAGLIALRNKGRAISEIEYINLENSYSQIMRRYGLPAGFYDDFDDYAKFIANDVSPAEVERRVQMAQNIVWNAPEETRQELQRLYGVSTGDMVAFMLEPGRILPTLEMQVQTATVSGMAKRAGLRQLSLNEAQRFSQLDPEEVAQRIALYQQAAFGEPIETRRELARLYGITDLTGELINPDKAVGVLQERLRAGRTAGLSARTGFGQLSVGEAERLGGAGTTEETFQQATRDLSLFTEVLPGFETIDETIGRGQQIDILAGDERARGRIEKKRSRRKAEFAGGGGVARTERGYSGLGTAES